MSKTKVVVFMDNTARVYTNPQFSEDVLAKPNVVVNPDLNKVMGIPPHHWKLVDGEVLPMNEEEKKARDAALNFKPVAPVPLVEIEVIKDKVIASLGQSEVFKQEIAERIFAQVVFLHDEIEKMGNAVKAYSDRRYKKALNLIMLTWIALLSTVLGFMYAGTSR